MGAVAAGSLAAGRAGGATARRPSESQPTPDLSVVTGHDHEADRHEFDVSTTELAAGWNTIRLRNPTDHTHFAYLAQLPQAAIDDASAAGAELRDFYVEHVTRPFQWFMDTKIPGKQPDPEDLSDRYSDLSADPPQVFPGWFGNVVPTGGVGFTSSETTSSTTITLPAGEYIMECYMKTDSGDFHSYHGMLEHLTVTEGESGTAPDPSLSVTVSTDGVDAPQRVEFGHHTIAVTFEDQQVYSHLIGHDLHLLRLSGTQTSMGDLNGWTNWLRPDGLVSDGSEPGEFRGGVEQVMTPSLMAGEGTATAYVHAALPPGRYAWVAEVPTPLDHGLAAPFVVPSPDSNRMGADIGGDAMPRHGDSRTFGAAGEPAADDLTERAAESRLPEHLKEAFDSLANRQTTE